MMQDREDKQDKLLRPNPRRQFRVEEVKFFPPNSNPYRHDYVSQGSPAPGNNHLEIMSPRKNILYIVNKVTGERIKIWVED